MSFYRKYRPQVIDEIDNSAIRDMLLSLLTKEKKDLPHAFLFTGTRGSGKTTAARVIAKLFNCQNLTKNGPCGKCDSCISIATGRYIDVLELDAASNRGIDEIRTLRDGIALAPVGGGYKVYIIDEVHMLTTEAFNALLKTLEEPPRHAIFVLATTDPQKVPATITSRCVVVSFKKALTDELLHALSRIVKEEKINIEKNALAIIAKEADGSFRDAVKYLEQASLASETITVEVIAKTLAHPGELDIQKLLSALTSRNAKEAIRLIGEMAANGKDMRAFLTGLLLQLEKQLIAQVTGTAKAGFSKDDVKDLIKRFSRAFGEMKTVSIPHLPLELAVVEFCDENSLPGHVELVSATPGVDKTLKTFRQDFDSELSRTAQGPKQVEGQVQGDSENRKSQTVKDLHESTDVPALGLISLDRLTECWKDVIEELKPYNHSLAGVLRSARPKAVADGIVTIEAFYKFHQEKLSEAKTKEMLSSVLKKLFGEKVRVEVVLGKK